MNRIKEVLAGSIAEEVEIECGDSLLTVNGHKIEDIIDYMFLLEEEDVVIEVQKKSGDIWEIEIEKDADEPLGVVFENAIIDEAKRCQNNCLFCFVDQLPTGMRESLYFKDDDSRLSFLQGNFVTLTNLDDAKLRRIIDYRISPINVSVHTTNPELRVRMLGNRFANKIMSQLKLLTENRIVVNAQIVLCPGYNDGEALQETLEDLQSLGDYLNSVAVVPIGLTKHRDHLPIMRGFDKEHALNVVKQVENYQTLMLKKRDSRFVFLADEFYIKAQTDFPAFEAYEGFLQYEDGVGMMRKLIDEVHLYLADQQTRSISRHVIIATGTVAGPFIKELAEAIMAHYPLLKVDVVPIVNHFFGEKITVSGLVTGQDILSQLVVKDEVDAILIPRNMLRSGERVLLDDITCDAIAAHYNKELIVVDEGGSDFVEAIINGGNHE